MANVLKGAFRTFCVPKAAFGHRVDNFGVPGRAVRHAAGMRNRVPVLLAMLALVMLAAVVAGGSSAVPVGSGKPILGFLRIPTINIPQEPRGRQVNRPEEPGVWGDLIGWFIVFSPFILLVVAIVVAAVLALRGRAERESSTRYPSAEFGYDQAPAASLLRAAQEARAVFAEHRAGPPGDAVIAAWLRLEEAAAEHGTRRHAHQTPTEFTTEVLAGHGAIGDALDELRRLYHRARFARTEAIGPAEAEAAGAALDRIVAGLTGEPVTR